jgi:multidrug transporter EmrE-like cation transporter
VFLFGAEALKVEWIALIVAVLANVLTNISLKLAAKNVASGSLGNLPASFLAQPWTWVGVAAGGILLASYVVAIRQLGLGYCYATVTSLALVLLTIAAAVVLGERLTLTSVVGVSLVLLGVLCLTYGEYSR